MQFQEEHKIQCPYCWETITVLVDPSVTHQEYAEDCQVCCRPILLSVICDNGTVNIQVDREND